MRYLLGCLLVMILALPVGCADKEAPPADEAAAVSAPDAQKLVGRWLRPDGGYVLEFGDVKKGGVVRAAYFNPNPITVGESKWSAEGSELHVFVKFDHPHYPGSYYDLVYDPSTDCLRGAYYQAVQDRTYSIEFVRHQ